MRMLDAIINHHASSINQITCGGPFTEIPYLSWMQLPACRSHSHSLAAMC